MVQLQNWLHATPFGLGCVVGGVALVAFGCGQRDAPLVAPAPRVIPYVSDACVAPPRPAARVRLTRAFSGLEVSAPVALVQAPRLKGELSGRWFIADQHGIVTSFVVDAEQHVAEVQVSDLRDRVHQAESVDERGLLGLALHPRFPNDPRIFVGYTSDEGGTMSQVSSFPVAAGQLDLAHETRLLQQQQPYTNHNGGHLAFGSDGLLYIGLGDGGSGGDPQGNGQNLQTWLGKMLRIDVDKTDGTHAYGIPHDNPFVDGSGLPEIYAYGLRNPWRYSFDRQTNELWLADVGQEVWEEVDLIVKGGNYGWSVQEGFRCFPPERSECQQPGMLPPESVYQHPDANQHRSVTGGFVYRGGALPDLVGRYVFADFLTGEVWALPRKEGPKEPELLLESGLQLSSFAEDEAGELYALDYAGGRVMKFGPGDEDGASLPARVSDTGCFDDDQPGQVTAEAVPYAVAQPFWSDGADKDRFIVLPKGQSLTLSAGGDFEVPAGTLLIKNFRLADRLIETRFYVRHADGEYSGYSYEWRKDGKDADLVSKTTQRTIGDREWIFPGREQCNQCHTAAAGRSLGLELGQLAVQTPSGAQLDTLRARQVISAQDAAQGTALAALTDEGRSLEERARAYLHVNCSGCHRPLGPGRGSLDLRVGTGLQDTGLCSVATLDALGTQRGALLEPGEAAESVFLLRMSRRDALGMPPLASDKVDDAGVELLSRWIESLQECPSPQPLEP